MSNINFVQLQKNIEKYGLEPAMKWVEQYPDTIHLPLGGAFNWMNSKEGEGYWAKIYANASQQTSNTPPTATQTSSKVLPMEEEIQKRLDARKAINAKNKAIHEKALELAEASRKKLEKKLKKLMVDSGVTTDEPVEDEDEDAPF